MKHTLTLIKQNKYVILFTVLYSVAFLLYARLFVILLPASIGLFLAVIGTPLCRMINKRFRINSKFSARITSILLAATFSITVITVTSLIRNELINLKSDMFVFRFSDLHPNVRSFIKSSINSLKQYTIESRYTTLIEHLIKALPRLFDYLLTLPTLLVFPVLSFLFCSFFLQVKEKMHMYLPKILGHENYERIDCIFLRRSKARCGFVLSYVIIYTITFTESIIILHLLQVKYPVITAATITVFDFFPVLGPGIILLPYSIYRLLCGDFVQAIGLFIGWILITVIRQIIEPKLISSITQTPILFMWFAVYTSLVTSNFWWIPYVALYFFFYPLFQEYNEKYNKTPSDQL